MLRAPTEGYAEAIVVPPILAEHFELKHSLINMMTSDQFFGLEKDNPINHIRWFNKITSTIKYKDVPNSAIKLMLFAFSLAGAARRWLEKEPPISNFQQKFDESFHEAWDRYKDLLRACPHHGFTELHQLDTFYNALNPADQDSLNSAAGGNLLERRTQDVLRIIENKSKVRNSRNKSIVSQVKSSDVNSSSSSDIAKLTHAVNQQTSAMTTAMTAILKQFKATPPPASVKAVEEICVTCGGAHPYYQCLAADGNTFPEFRDNIQGYVATAAGNYNQGNSAYRPPGVANQTRPPGFAQPNRQNDQNRFSQPQGYNRGNKFNKNAIYQAPIQQNQSVPLSELEKFKKTNEANMKAMQNQINNVKNELRNEMQNSIQTSMSNQTNELKNMMASFFQMNTASTSGTGSLPSNIVANPKGELKAITTRSGLVLDGPSIPMPPPFINPEEDEHVEETLTDPDLGEFTIKVPPPLVQKSKPSSQRNYVVHQRDPRHPHIPYPSRMNQEKQKEKDEVQIHKFWKMFKQLHINITLADALVLIPKYQKMLKSLLSNKEKLLELANTPLNENCSAVILKKLPEKLGASINLMPLSVWKKLGLPELISTQMTLELANREICTPVGIARDVFVPVGRFTFPADFVIVDYESDPRVPLILGRPFLRTARALIDVHREEMILCDGDERLTLNMRHDTSSYSNKPKKESINQIDISMSATKDYLEDLFANEKITNHQSGNPTFFSHIDLTSPEVINPLSGSTTSSSPSLSISDTSDYSLEEFADELTHFTFPPGIDYLLFDAESDLREIEYFSDEHALDYSPHPLCENKIKVSKLLVDELDSTGSSSFLPHFLECDSVLYEDFSEVDTLTSTDNEDKVFNPGILVHENLYEVTNRVTPDKNVKKKSSSNASLILEDFNPPLSDHELPFHIEIPGSETLLSFSSENEEKVFNPGILISKGVHSLLPELSHRDSKAFKVINIFESPMEIFPCSYGEDIRVLDVPWVIQGFETDKVDDIPDTSLCGVSKA
ncbi:reverse transcriptase domain-containing protein [Tanacetum coccineum]|uniref:Reverse transcriptase domain-containing protein n=1 Tax=Tanacetum coccineum TaxID=301880 RepID=A0ABQ4XFS6_9ASTR